MVLLVVFIMEVGNRTIRPQLFSYLFFLLLLMVIYAAETGRLRALWLAPPLVAVWANFHGAFLAGLGLLAVWSAARIITTLAQRDGIRPCWRIALPAAVAAAAAMLNPYGPKLLPFLWKAVVVTRPDITEFQPVCLTNTEGIAYLTLIGLSIAALAMSGRRRSPAVLAAFAATAVLPLFAFRHLPFAALAAAVLAGPHLAAAWDRYAAPKGTGLCFRSTTNLTPPPLKTGMAASLIPFTAALLLSGLTIKHSLQIAIDPDKVAYPVRAVALLKAAARGETWQSGWIGASMSSGIWGRR